MQQYENNKSLKPAKIFVNSLDSPMLEEIMDELRRIAMKMKGETGIEPGERLLKKEHDTDYEYQSQSNRQQQK